MAIRTFQELIQLAQSRGPKHVVLVAADQWEALEAAALAYQRGLAEFTLFGDVERIETLLAEGKFDLGFPEIIHEPSQRRAAERAVEMARNGLADIIMNAKAQPRHLVRVADDPVSGLRNGDYVMSDVAVFEIPNFDRLIFVTDILVCTSPDLQTKACIVQNAINVARALGVERPRVAILSATEAVNPKIPISIEAANLSKMAQRGQIVGGIVDGPLALDNAISEIAASIKGIESEVAGRADILIAPDIEAGNLLAKAITYFAGGQMASVIVGGRCPIVMPSRSDPPDAKLASLALGVYLSTLRYEPVR
ncbi:MAG: bifunctional enoyl-CoA hydratase/phosphate acetyltransferase [Anaerolineae bacterium]